MNQRKKIYYLPGMISLISMPVLFLISGIGTDPNEDLRVLEIHWFRDVSPPQRNYTSIHLGSDTVTDLVKLEFSRVIASEIESAKDTINGLRIVFGEEAKYRSIVKAINDMNNIGATYLPVGNEFFIWHRQASFDTSAFQSRGRCVIELEKLVLAENDVMTKVLEQSWLFIMIFSILLILGIRWTYRLTLTYRKLAT